MCDSASGLVFDAAVSGAGVLVDPVGGCLVAPASGPVAGAVVDVAAGALLGAVDDIAPVESLGVAASEVAESVFLAQPAAANPKAATAVVTTVSLMIDIRLHPLCCRRLCACDPANDAPAGEFL